MTEAHDAADESLRRIVREAAESARSVQDLYSGSEAERAAICKTIKLAEKVAAQGRGSGLTYKELDASASHASDLCLDARDPYSQSAALAARCAALAARELLFAESCERAGITWGHSAISTFASRAHEEARRIRNEKTS